MRSTNKKPGVVKISGGVRKFHGQARAVIKELSFEKGKVERLSWCQGRDRGDRVLVQLADEICGDKHFEIGIRANHAHVNIEKIGCVDFPSFALCIGERSKSGRGVFVKLGYANLGGGISPGRSAADPREGVAAAWEEYGLRSAVRRA